MRTLGQKEEAVKAQPFHRISIFRPGMLERLLSKDDPGYRWHENFATKLTTALKVSDLAKAMIFDAEKQAEIIAGTTKQEASEGGAAATEETTTIHEGNGTIIKLANL
jgi:hypothetical protein